MRWIACLLWLVACSEGASDPALLGAGTSGIGASGASAQAAGAGMSAGMMGVVEPGAGASGANAPTGPAPAGMGGIAGVGGMGGAPSLAPNRDAGAGDAGVSGGAGTAGAAGTSASPAPDASAPVPTDAPPTEASLRMNGPFAVQSYSLGFAVGPSFPGGTIWYPSNAAHALASIAIVPGYLSPRILIEGWGPFLASHGIVTFTIDTNTPGDQPDQRSRALLNALESLRAEHTRAGSPLAGKLDNARQAVGGWSMGGGGALITVNGHPELKAAIAMCSWRPGGRFTTNRVPTLLFASAGDPLASGQSQGFYTSIPASTPKILFEWGVADHLLANAPTGAGGQVGRFGLAWLKVFLEEDERYRPFIESDCEGCTDFRANLP